jgi:hypothetical protein
LNRHTDLPLFDAADLMQAIGFLDEFLVVKVADSSLCQQAWDHASWMSETFHIPLGFIRQEWKETSNVFSQRFHLPHIAPQIVHIKQDRVQSSWPGKIALSASLPEDYRLASSLRESQLYRLLAYRKLEGVCEVTAGSGNWHQDWFNQWLELISKASLEDSLQVLVESFRVKWYPLFQSSWEEISLSDRALFVKEACLLKETWIQKIKRQGRL